MSRQSSCGTNRRARMDSTGSRLTVNRVHEFSVASVFALVLYTAVADKVGQQLNSVGRGFGKKRFRRDADDTNTLKSFNSSRSLGVLELCLLVCLNLINTAPCALAESCAEVALHELTTRPVYTGGPVRTSLFVLPLDRPRAPVLLVPRLSRAFPPALSAAPSPHKNQHKPTKARRAPEAPKKRAGTNCLSRDPNPSMSGENRRNQQKVKRMPPASGNLVLKVVARAT